MKAKPSYTKWRKRLAGETVIAFTEPDENDVGFIVCLSWSGR